ncbi:sugar phosphate isomerase/epimerase, partial [Alphaproteobacteria bacterium]|nr:sugar phosphate isomerase/epimerase [Alphaproteobacteria bacterium]
MSNTIRFGMVQGRLTQSPPGCLQWFPQEKWQAEFNVASSIGIDYIELIAEVQHNAENPIWKDSGIEEIKKLVKVNGLTLHALCNDYIVEHQFLLDDVIQQNITLINQGKKLGVEKYIMPFFESSELTKENMLDYIEPIKRVAKVADDKNILVCLETILTGEELIELLNLIDKPNVKAVYDTGNRVAFGHDLPGDIRLLSDNIAHVHIKDKNKHNENVLLGTGLVDFKSVFYALDDIKYEGPYTFETTRGTNPINTAKYNINLVNFFNNNAEKAKIILLIGLGGAGQRHLRLFKTNLEGKNVKF